MNENGQESFEILSYTFTAWSLAIAIISMIIALVALIVSLYDRYKDNRQLQQHVQGFYNTLENLTVLYYTGMILKNRKESLRNDAVKAEINTRLVKINLKKKYQQHFIKYRAEEMFKYLGLVYYQDANKYIINMNAKFRLSVGGQLAKIPEGTNPYLLEYENVVKDLNMIKDAEVKEIDDFFTSLRLYWEKNYHKRILGIEIRPKLEKVFDLKEKFNEIKNQFSNEL